MRDEAADSIAIGFTETKLRALCLVLPAIGFWIAIYYSSKSSPRARTAWTYWAVGAVLWIVGLSLYSYFAGVE